MESETLTGRELGQLFLEARRRRGNIDAGPETTLEPFNSSNFHIICNGRL